MFANAVCSMGSSTLAVVMAAGGGGEEAHHSILRLLHLILPIEEVLPQPSKQPDLILNTLFVLGVVLVVVLTTVRSLQRIPEGTVQNLLEMIVEGLYSFFIDIVGERGKKYIPFFGSFFIYILLLNWLGLIPGLQSPTADLNTTVSFAIISVVSANVFAARELGLGPYLKHFLGEPLWLSPLMCPLHIIGEFAKMISLSVRLFGNVFGEDMIILILAGLSPVFLFGHIEVPYLPVQLPIMLFATFTSLIQAMIFSVLSAVYLATFLSEHAEEHH